MQTIDLIHKAEQRGFKLAELSRELGLNANSLARAKHRQHLSAAEAAGLAELLGENVGAYTVAAVAESDRTSDTLRGRLNRLLRGIHL